MVNQRDLKQPGWKQALLLLVVIFGYSFIKPHFFEASGNGQLKQLHQAKSEGEWVEVEGRVYHILTDDIKGDQHQRFLISTEGLSVLVAHNIDLAPRVPIELRDGVKIRGEYVWNEKGGVIHWTHHDPRNRHAGGWIEHDGKIFK